MRRADDRRAPARERVRGERTQGDPPRAYCRALDQSERAGIYRGRAPTVKPELKAVKLAFSKNRFATKPAKITSEIMLNAGKEKLRKRIVKKFKAATENDISYFYFSGHGIYTRGQYYVIPCLGQAITATELRSWLDPIPGKIVLILNACFSGKAIGKSASDARGDFAQGFTDAFLNAGAGKKAAIGGEKYIVITSSAGNQSALYWDVDFFGYTFGRYVGWDAKTRKRTFDTTAMDETGGMTLTKLGPALRDGVQALIDHYNQEIPDAQLPPQTVCFAPETDDTVIFGFQQ